MGEILAILKDLPYGGISFAGLVTLAIVLIFRGEIVPRSTLEQMLAARDGVIKAKVEENQMLKDAYILSEKARVTGAEADKELLELGRTTVHLLQSIHDKAREVQT